MITMDKKYKYRNGQPARVLCVDRGTYCPVVSVSERGAINAHFADGHYGSGGDHNLDLIEVSPWEDFKIDEPVMVRNTIGKNWIRRYFAGVKHGTPTTFEGGKTSWPSAGLTSHWDECRRPTEEELE